MNEEPPLPIKAAIVVAILFVGIYLSPRLRSSDALALLSDSWAESDIILSQSYTGLKNGYIDSNMASYLSPVTLGSMVTNPRLDNLGLSYSEKLLLDKIISCESGWRNVCNAQFGCAGGAGVAQLIPRTVKHCSDNLGKTINPHNERDSLECAAWLLTQTSQGPYHWGYPPSHPSSRMKNGQVWGSWSCWQSYLTY